MISLDNIEDLLVVVGCGGDKVTVGKGGYGGGGDGHSGGGGLSGIFLGSKTQENALALAGGGGGSMDEDDRYGYISSGG
jgi:hypothetical protein